MYSWIWGYVWDSFLDGSSNFLIWLSGNYTWLARSREVTGAHIQETIPHIWAEETNEI